MCVGLDPEPKKFPDRFRDAPGGIFEFNKAIIDATRDLVCAYKPQFAHYAAHAAENQLEHTIDYIKSTLPERHRDPRFSKRGDIGSTAEQYAHEAFERYDADAVTVNPYLGRDSVEPFLKHGDKGVIILCRTSNPGAKDFQDLDVGRQEAVPARRRAGGEGMEHGWQLHAGGGRHVSRKSSPTFARASGDLPFLVPGVGAQGGDVAKVMAAGKTAAGTGLVISSSRAILYASSGDDFAKRRAQGRAGTAATRSTRIAPDGHVFIARQRRICAKITSCAARDLLQGLRRVRRDSSGGARAHGDGVLDHQVDRTASFPDLRRLRGAVSGEAAQAGTTSSRPTFTPC